jgi:predicted amidophosphoribosyltransferase
VLGALLDLLAPPRCLACGGGVAGAPLCRDCRAALPWLRSVCPRCGLPRPCSPCPAARAAFTSAWAPVAYGGPARELVAALKVRGALPAAGIMAAQVAARLDPLLVAGAVLVPVPAAPSRARRRGLDPAALLAREIGRRAGVPVDACLRRRGAAARQAGASRATRLRAGRVVVGVRSTPPVRVVLVDDVHTTGATLDACARALRSAGTRNVVALTYARTLRAP